MQSSESDRMVWPDRWGEGALFAFSGVDGETDALSGFVASLGADPFDLLWHTPRQRRLRLRSAQPATVRILTGDVVVADSDAGPLVLTFSAWHTLVGTVPPSCRLELCGADEQPVPATAAGDGAWWLDLDAEHGDALALCRKNDCLALAFGRSAAQAEARAREGLLGLEDGVAAPGAVCAERKPSAAAPVFPAGTHPEAPTALPDGPLAALIAERLAFVASAPRLAHAGRDRLLKKCFSVMKVNSLSAQGPFRQRWSTPDRVPHRDLWLWDSVFHSLGMNHLSPALAWDFLASLLDTQQSDGRMPLQTTPDGRVVDTTQPPVLAWGVWQTVMTWNAATDGTSVAQENSGWLGSSAGRIGPRQVRQALTVQNLARSDTSRATGNDVTALDFSRRSRAAGLLLNDACKAAFQRALPALEAYLEWDCAQRDSNRNGLLEWKLHPVERCRCGESGLDNSPRFDAGEPLDAVDFSTLAAHDMRYVARIAAALGAKDKARLWSQRSAALSAQVHELLWDEHEGFYFDRTLDGRLTGVQAVTGFLPLLLDDLPAERLDRLVARLRDPRHFDTAFPIPSLAVSHPAWSTDMWRGATWINLNYLVVQGLKRQGRDTEAERLATQTVAQVRKYFERHGVIFEFYDAMDALPPLACERKGPRETPYNIRRKVDSIRDYHWSAALTACLLLETAALR